jgi:MFS family permease
MQRPTEIASPRYRLPAGDRDEPVTAAGATGSRAGPDASSPAAAAPATRWPRLRLVLVGLGISVVPLDTSVNIAFPDITGSFGLPIAMIQWVIICYVLTNAGPLLAFGRVGDLWGHGRVFRAGLGWSFAAFLLCAAAPSFGWLLFFRFLQGIGAALIISCAPAIVTSLYPEARRSRALAAFTLIFALASATGPLIGGALVARWGWPAVFWFRAPIALTSLIFLRGLPAPASGSRDRRFDIAGALLLAAGLAALLLAINALARVHDGNYLALLLLPAAGAILATFVWWETRAAQPIIRIELFRHAGFAIINLASTLMYLTTFSVMLIGPFFIKPIIMSRYGDHWGGFAAGAVLGSGFIAMSLASPLAGSLVARFGAARVAPLGALLIGLGLFLVGSWQPQTPSLAMASVLALQGIGTGLFQVAYMDLVLAASPVAHRGVAGSLSMLTRTVGVVIAAAGLTLAFQAMQTGARAGGAADAQAFLMAFHAMFRLCGGGAALVGVLVALSAMGFKGRRRGTR